MKGKLLAGAALLLVAGFVAARLTGRLGGQPVRIGVLLPLSGPDAPLGLGLRNSIRLAIEEANGRGGVEGHKLELVELDDRSDPATAAAAAKRLVDDPRVVAALVHADDDTSTATKEIFQVAGLPNILVAVPNREQAEALGDAESRLLPLGVALQTQAVQYAAETLGAKSFGYVCEDSAFGKSMVNQFRTALSEKTGHLVVGGELRIKAGDTDFKSTVDHILADPPQYLLFGGRPREAALLLVQLRAAGYTGYYQSATHHPSQEFIDLAQGKAEGALQVFHGLPAASSPAGKAYLDAYAAHGFPEPPSIDGIYAYAAAQSLAAAMGKSFLTRPSIKGALQHEQLETALGPIRYYYLGSTYQQVAVYQVIKGQWSPVAATGPDHKLHPYTSR